MRTIKVLKYWVSVFVLSVSIFYAGFFLDLSETSILQFIEVVIGTYAFFIVLYTLSLFKDLKFVVANDIKLRWLIKLELFPSVGFGLRDRVWLKLTELHPKLSNNDIKKKVLYDSPLTRSSKIKMDIIANLKDDFLDESELIIVKIYENGIVGANELRSIGSTILKFRILHPLSEVEMVLVVSKNGFSQDVLNKVQAGKIIGLNKFSTRLIVPQEAAFSVMV